MRMERKWTPASCSRRSPRRSTTSESRWTERATLTTAPGLAAVRTARHRCRRAARTRAADRGRTRDDRDDVAMSLFVQGYAFRIASLAIGTSFLGDHVVDVSPATTAIALGRDRPNAVRLDGARLTAAPLHEHLIDEHLAALVDTAHRACRIGEALLWANVGASCASSFGAFVEPLPDRPRRGARSGRDSSSPTPRPELARSGRVVRVGDGWAWERSACCLWYQTDVGFKCEDCSLWTSAEREARYAAMLAERAAP